MADAKHELEAMLDVLQARDRNAVLDLNNWMGPGPTIENRIGLADGRALDALMAVATLAKYIMKKEQQAEERTDGAKT